SSGLEGSGGVEAFVFDEHIGILAAGEHRREAFPKRDWIGFGQNRVITPHGGRASGQARGRESALDGSQIVARVENSTVFGTDCLRAVGGKVFSTASALKMSEAG